MRASGREAGRARGGIRSPAGPSCVLGHVRAGPFRARGRLLLRAGSFCVRGRLLLRAGLFCGLGDNEWL